MRSRHYDLALGVVCNGKTFSRFALMAGKDARAPGYAQSQTTVKFQFASPVRNGVELAR